jgi:hypothetical protein
MRLIDNIRTRVHPFWRLRRSSLWRQVQRQFDPVVYVRIPETGVRCAAEGRLIDY